jgi:hypothetical protein
MNQTLLKEHTCALGTGFKLVFTNDKGVIMKHQSESDLER